MGRHNYLRGPRSRIHEAPSGVPQKQRGTYAGFTKEVIAYVKSLGITSVELLPVHTFINDSQLLERELTNYWGYNSIGFFAPDPALCIRTGTVTARVQGDGRRFHDAGLEVILDVVVQPHCRRQRARPHIVLKGIDNASYYRLLSEQPALLRQQHWTGNTLNLSHARVVQMVMDSLRYWVNETHVDGFRFDLEPSWHVSPRASTARAAS